MSAPLLQVRNLDTVFRTDRGRLHVVRDVSFDVHEGEIVGIVGESGSGKSVTLRSILRLLRPPTEISGEVLWRGENVLELSRRDLRERIGGAISMIFQEPMTALNPVLSVGEQLRETLAEHTTLNRKQLRARQLELLDLVGIPSPRERLADYPHQFSGGMRQRVMIAIALASEPELLLADEPTTALDVTIQDQILKLLQRLKAELGMSVLLVTHDLGVVAQSCDRVAVMYAGRLAETASARDLFRQPRHAYTLGLLDSLPGQGGERRPLDPIPGAPLDLATLPDACAFAPRCRFADDACLERVPPLVTVAPARRSACVHYDRLPKARLANEEVAS